MQNYSHALDVDMLNQRYWHRRMQQCKAEFKANYSRPTAPKLASNSVNLSPHSSFEDPLPSSAQSPTAQSRTISMAGTQSRPLSKTVIPKPLTQPMDASVSDRLPDEQPSQVDPWLTSSRDGLANRERPIPTSSKPSRPIKYQVR